MSGGPDHASLDEFLLGNQTSTSIATVEAADSKKEQTDTEKGAAPTPMEKSSKLPSRKASGTKNLLSPGKKQSQPVQGKARRAFFTNSQTVV